MSLPNLSTTLLTTAVLLLSRVLISAEVRFTPRGVPLSRSSLYDPAQKEFSCLDGSKLIPFSFVNDDYCDCRDGSDEPGTSACNKGSFFCLNAGHVSSYLRSSKVDDGVCDCCDGSDESSTTRQRSKLCPNTCTQLGDKTRAAAEAHSLLLKEGHSKRLELSTAGASLRGEREAEKNRLESQLAKAELIKQERQLRKESAEGPEKEALDRYEELERERRREEEELEKTRVEDEAGDKFNLIDSDGDGVLTIGEIQARATFDKNGDGVVDEEEAMFFLNFEREMGLEEWRSGGWGVAKAFFLLEEGVFMGPDSHSTVGGGGGDEGEEEHEHEPANEEQIGEEQEQPYEDDEAEAEEAEPTPKEDQEKYDPATRALIEEADRARGELAEAEKVAREISSKLQEVNDYLALDFGEDERFAPLYSSCYDYEDREYTYGLCPFKEATQRPKSGAGGSQMNLGKWTEWSGPESSKHTQMLYSNGQSCWNGPARSARINLRCGLEHRIVSVTEPSRCEYHYEFQTPAACDESSLPQQQLQHDEL